MDFRSQTYQQCCIPIDIYIFLTSLKVRLILCFFPLNVSFFFFFLNHTLVKHCHIAPDYRLQNHIHTCLSQRDAPTQMQPGVKEGVPNAFLGMDLKADPSLLPPLAGSIFFFFHFFLAKVNLSNHRNQMCPFTDFFLFFSPIGICTETSPCDFPLPRLLYLTGPCCSVETHSLSLPLTFHPLTPPRKNPTTWEVTSLASFCLVLDISLLDMKKTS